MKSTDARKRLEFMAAGTISSIGTTLTVVSTTSSPFLEFGKSWGVAIAAFVAAGGAYWVQHQANKQSASDHQKDRDASLSEKLQSISEEKFVEVRTEIVSKILTSINNSIDKIIDCYNELRSKPDETGITEKYEDITDECMRNVCELQSMNRPWLTVAEFEVIGFFYEEYYYQYSKIAGVNDAPRTLGGEDICWLNSIFNLLQELFSSNLGLRYDRFRADRANYVSYIKEKGYSWDEYQVLANSGCDIAITAEPDVTKNKVLVFKLLQGYIEQFCAEVSLTDVNVALENISDRNGFSA